VFIRLILKFSNGESERTAFSQFGFYPDPAAVQFHDFFAIGKPDTIPGKLIVAIEAIENVKHLFKILGVNSDAVI
jgi:hypothetical protein